MTKPYIEITTNILSSMAGDSKIKQKFNKWLEKIASVINLYSIPFVTKPYNHILQTLSSNSF